MRPLARAALLAAALLLACRGGVTLDRWVVMDQFLMTHPELPGWPQPTANYIVASVVLGERVELLEEREGWCRVRNTAGKEGWIQGPFLVSGSMLPAVVLEPGPCHRGRFFGGLTGTVLQPGELVFVEPRRFGRWRVDAGKGDLCEWLDKGVLSTELEDLETAKLVHRAARAHAGRGKKDERAAELLERARTLYPGARAQSLIAPTAAATAPPPTPPQYEPPPLAEGEVPPSKADPAGECLPVPEEYPGTYVGDPTFDIRPVQTDGGRYAVAPPRLPLEWKGLVAQHCPWLKLEPVADAGPDARRSTLFQVAAPEAETAGRWYLATRHGVFAARPGALRGRVQTPITGKDDFVGELMLRPAPAGGAGFAFWSPAARMFRACPIAMPDPRSPHLQRGLRSAAEPDGKLAILVGDEGATRRARIERASAPIHSGYKLDLFPGGEFLFVALEDVSYAAYNVQPKSCRPALLLRWSDLAEVARVECDPR